MADQDEKIRLLTNAVLYTARAVISVRGMVMELMADPSISEERRLAADKQLNDSFGHVNELLEVVKELSKLHGSSDG